MTPIIQNQKIVKTKQDAHLAWLGCMDTPNLSHAPKSDFYRETTENLIGSRGAAKLVRRRVRRMAYTLSTENSLTSL